MSKKSIDIDTQQGPSTRKEEGECTTTPEVVKVESSISSSRQIWRRLRIRAVRSKCQDRYCTTTLGRCGIATAQTFERRALYECDISRATIDKQETVPMTIKTDCQRSGAWAFKLENDKSAQGADCMEPVIELQLPKHSISDSKLEFDMAAKTQLWLI